MNYAAAGVGGRTISGASLGGQWDLIGHSGVSVMHAVMRPFSNSIFFLERVQASTFARMQGTSENGNKYEHFAWSIVYSANDGQWRALDVKSNMFCSAGGDLPDGVSRHFLFCYTSVWILFMMVHYSLFMSLTMFCLTGSYRRLSLLQGDNLRMRCSKATTASDCTSPEKRHAM